MRAAVFILTVLTVAATSAGAELVVFSSGHVLKVDAYVVDGSEVSLDFGGGKLTVRLTAIERILDDEVLPPQAGELPPVSESVKALQFRDGDPVPETPFGELIYRTARRHGINPALVAAMVRAESAFDENAVSVKGARGLLQLMPATGRRFGVEGRRLFEPAANLEAGVSYLKWLRRRFSDDLPLVLAAYNAGEGNVDRYGGVPPFRETRDYILRIYRFLGLDPRS